MPKAPMKRSHASVPLEIEVRNFGPISRGKFRLKPLTVFVGPNNAGKTFAATLAHSVISSRGEHEHPLDYARWVKRELRGHRLKPLVSGMERLVEGASATGTEIPSKYTNAVQDIVLEHIFGKSMLGTISGNFGSRLNRLVRIGQRSSTIKVKYHIGANVRIGATGSPTVKMGRMGIAYSIRKQRGGVLIYENAEKIFGGHIDPVLIDKGVQDYIGMVSRHLGLKKGSGLYWLLRLMKRMECASMCLPRSCYLPAARSGILSARDPIVSSTIKGSGHAGADLPHRLVSGVMSNYLESLVHIGECAPPANGKNGHDVFRDLFGGSLGVQVPKAGLPQIFYKMKGAGVPLNLMSSSMAETAPLQLFLQDRIPRAEVLILEEPEAHLHPENQAKLAKHIVRLVNSGVHVLLITHGLYFLEQLSIFVRMSQVSAKDRKKLGYGEGDCLNVEDVAPYQFKRSGLGGYRIQELEHTPKDGISQGEFDRIVDVIGNKEIQIDHMIGDP